MILKVMKTLVIGLGSTGTRICDQLAERVKWEYGSLNRTPWIEVICIETDANEPTNELGDHCTRMNFTISPDDYRRYVERPENYDEEIRLSQWIHRETLQHLPARQVKDGAGNIRMVGRLAFLHRPNFSDFYQRTESSLQRLRELEAAKAAEAFGKMPDGTDANVEWADGGKLRVFVVGTACGGTCSGSIADIGFTLERIVGSQGTTYCFLTLPHQRLTSVMVDQPVNRFKRNAFIAVQELRHYLQPRLKWPPIRYPDGTEARPGDKPFDAIFLFTTKDAGKNYEDYLKELIADILFLNIFTPEVDPAGELANVPPGVARDFHTIGMASLEFPAFRIMEACTRRLLAWTLAEWLSAVRNPNSAEQHLAGLKLTFEGLEEVLARTESGNDLRTELRQQVSTLSVHFRTLKLEETERALQALRQRFDTGKVTQTLKENLWRLPVFLKEQLRNFVDRELLRIDGGPRVLNGLLEAIARRLAEMSEAKPSDQEPRNANECLETARRLRESVLLGLLFMRGRAVRAMTSKFEALVNNEINSRLRKAVIEAIQGRGKFASDTERPPLRQMEDIIKPIRQRVGNLIKRVEDLRIQEDQRAKELSETRPPTNGECLFEPDTSRGGTTRAEYEALLQAYAKDPAAEWSVGRKKAAAEILASWTSLPALLLPLDQSHSDYDFLMDDFRPEPGRCPIERADYDKIMAASREPFKVMDRDVLKRWKNSGQGKVERARAVFNEASPFLGVDEARATRGARTGVEKYRYVLVPEGCDPEAEQEFLEAIKPVETPGIKKDIKPREKHRVVVLSHVIGFPLEAIPSIVSVDGIGNTECNDFPFWHSRNDVEWEVLETEADPRIHEVRQLFAVALLANIVSLQKGLLVIETTDPIRGAQTLRFPMSLLAAAKQVVMTQRDLDGKPLGSLESDLVDRVRAKRADMGDREFVSYLFSAWRRRQPSHQVEDFDNIPELLKDFCESDSALMVAYKAEAAPDAEKKKLLYKKKGDLLCDGRQADKDGYYCEHCGAFIGVDETEAAKNEWTCPHNNGHYFGRVPRPAI